MRVLIICACDRVRTSMGITFYKQSVGLLYLGGSILFLIDGIELGNTLGIVGGVCFTAGSIILVLVNGTE